MALFDYDQKGATTRRLIVLSFDPPSDSEVDSYT